MSRSVFKNTKKQIKSECIFFSKLLSAPMIKLVEMYEASFELLTEETDRAKFLSEFYMIREDIFKNIEEHQKHLTDLLSDKFKDLKIDGTRERVND